MMNRAKKRTCYSSGIDDDKFIVRDGIVIDKNFLEYNYDKNKAAVSKHIAHLTLNLHLLPILKNGPSSAMSLKDSEKTLNNPNFSSKVTPSSIV